MSTVSLQFQNRVGQTLSGRLEMPDMGPARAYAVFAHCFTCGKAIPAAVRISRALADEGIATLRFDFTGLSESEGEFAEGDFTSNVSDLVCAADYLAEHYALPQILIGHSLGGTAALQAAKDIASVWGVCTIGSPSDPGHALHLFEDSLETIREQGEGRVVLTGREFKVTRAFVEDFEAAKMEETIGSLRRALLVMHSPFDKIVGVDHAAAIFAAAKHPKSFVSLDDADHMLREKRDTEYAARMIAAWASRFVEPEAESAEDSEPRPTRAVIGQDKYETRLRFGRHHYTADEPSSVGGSDKGPTPYDLLNGALGACTAMTLRMYADRKEWPLESVDVEIRHEKIHATDCEECESEEGKVDRFERVVSMTGDLDEEQRARLLEIADKCPVHRTLHDEVVVHTVAGEE